MKSTELKRSPGNRKAARTEKNCARSGRAITDHAADEQIRRCHLRRWPDKEQENKYFELNTDKKQRGKPAKRIKPPVLEFALLESIDPKTLNKLLIASSLKVKKVRRYPGWILQTTYNLKSRPIQII